LLDLAFLVDDINHVDYLNLKLQGKEKLFPSLVNDIRARGVGVKKPLSLIFNKNFITRAKEIACFRIFFAC